ncbi:MAG: hypothetical protein HQK54_12680, partial [Oligoflexales bacterium]|nr:hypothetical protein [Oligoflexales bacterium]
MKQRIKKYLGVVILWIARFLFGIMREIAKKIDFPLDEWQAMKTTDLPALR